MSMEKSFYIGAYLVVTGVSRELIEEFESVVYNGQGELTDWRSDTRFLIPNFRIPEAELRDDPDVPVEISGNGIFNEMQAFSTAASGFCDRVSSSGGTYQMRWGIVPGYF